jgi:hypothetical protein
MIDHELAGRLATRAGDLLLDVRAEFADATMAERKALGDKRSHHLFAAMAELFGGVLGDWVAAAMCAPFSIGTPDELADLLRAPFPDVVVQRHDGQACFASLDDWLHTEIRGWTLAEHVDDEQFARLRAHAPTRLARFVAGDGRVRFAAPALIATATAP